MLSRRELLALPAAVAAGAVMAACSREAPPPPDPQLVADTSALREALQLETELLDLGVARGLSPVEAVTAEHVSVLAATLGATSSPTPSATGSPSGPSMPALDPTRQLAAAAESHLAAMAAVSGPVARLLASLAASDLALAAALRRADRQETS